MGMVVRSNVMAVNAFRQLGMNNSQVSKSLEKLSSGYRINRAGDDASGLAISEKMKAQIKGLETASSNSQDGISLIQTAEGALTEVHDMLNRMVELAGKAANGTMDDDVDRDALQKEVDALKDEIDRIADGTNFNGLKLLNGSLGDGRAEVVAAKAEYETAVQQKLDKDGKLTIAGHTVDIQVGTQDDLKKQLEAWMNSYKNTTAGQNDWDVKLNDDENGIVFTAKKEGALDTLGIKAPTGTTQKTAGADASPAVDGNGGLTLQIGDTADDFNKITVSINDMSARGLGIADINVGTQDGAATALDLVKKGAASAINMVSATRADLGAMQNRLEHTINNLDVAAENMTSANSRIRDTDMAKQMMEYTKMNVLTQAAQAMLAQANQQPQSVLQLLQ
mgnify:CR=1 FL=1